MGAGPAGSVCARRLVLAGLRVAVLERQRFPRVKLCGGWLSPPVWEVLELSPKEYTGGIWPWKRCHVQHGGRLHTRPGDGYFIRRYEFDDFLLRRSGVEVIQHSVRRVERRDGQWVLDDIYRAPVVIGAGGTHCPVARQIFPAERKTLVAAQELEFSAGAALVGATRVGEDGEPELFLHDDLGGYSWNVPKGEWLNVGTGTSEPKQVLSAWASARAFFSEAGHLPDEARASLEDAKGHSYYLFDPRHLAACERDGAVLVGDALGLAHPLTAEGILPAVLSGRLAGDAVVARALGSYRTALAEHPVMRDYELAHTLLNTAIDVRDRWLANRRHLRVPSALLSRIPVPKRWSEARESATATAFAWMFSGRPIPYASVLRAVLPKSRSSTEKTS